MLRRSEREHVLPGKYKDFHVDSTGLPGLPLPPSANDSLVANTSGMDGGLGYDAALHQEALARTDIDAWRREMQEEFDAQVAAS